MFYTYFIVKNNKEQANIHKLLNINKTTKYFLLLIVRHKLIPCTLEFYLYMYIVHY